MTDQSMWKFMSLTDWQYKHLCNTITTFLNDVNNLIVIQESGNVPLILSFQQNSVYCIIISPGTLELMCKIDSTFALFHIAATDNSISEDVFNSYNVLVGNKETYRMYLSKRSQMDRIKKKVN